MRSNNVWVLRNFNLKNNFDYIVANDFSGLPFKIQLFNVCVVRFSAVGKATVNIEMFIIIA